MPYIIFGLNSGYPALKSPSRQLNPLLSWATSRSATDVGDGLHVCLCHLCDVGDRLEMLMVDSLYSRSHQHLHSEVTKLSTS